MITLIINLSKEEEKVTIRLISGRIFRTISYIKEDRFYYSHEYSTFEKLDDIDVTNVSLRYFSDISYEIKKMNIYEHLIKYYKNPHVGYIHRQSKIKIVLKHSKIYTSSYLFWDELRILIIHNYNRKNQL